jgi:uncharacterized OB-fold protein
MSAIESIGTYLPPWRASGSARVAGSDEDALTMAVEAGRAALAAATTPVERLIFVSRELPLLEGGNAAALLAGLGLAASIETVEQIGGAPAALDAIATAPPGTLVVAADLAGAAGAGAVMVKEGDDLVPGGRVHRSLPLRARGHDGVLHEDDDPRLQRERGVGVSLGALTATTKPLAVAGISRKDAASYCEGDPPTLPTLGASAAVFALAAVAERGSPGLVAAVEQATASALSFDPGGSVVLRVEPEARPAVERRTWPGPEIRLAFTAYSRQFESKLSWEAGSCPACGTLALPQRFRCLSCGDEGRSELVPLPRTATVYAATTIHVPVPGLSTPYTLAVVEMDGVGVRALVTVTDAVPGSTQVGDHGDMVLRRVAVRSGVPDYGYAFSPSGLVERPTARLESVGAQSAAASNETRGAQ